MGDEVKYLICTAATAVLVPSALFAGCDNAYLNGKDKGILDDVAQIEKKAGAVQTIIAFAPITQILSSGSAIEASFVARSNDMNVQEQSISAMGKIAASENRVGGRNVSKWCLTTLA